FRPAETHGLPLASLGRSCSPEKACLALYRPVDEKCGQGVDYKQTGLYSSCMAHQRETSEARQRILETADRLFYRDGIRAVGIDRIVAEANVAKMSLYKHFPSKDDLILAVLMYREEGTLAFFRSAIERYAKKAKSPLRAFFAALKEWFETPGFRGCPFQ